MLTMATMPPQPDATAKPSPARPQGFQDLRPPLSAGVLDYATQQRFVTMTPVQAATIPLFRARKDVAVQAVTGSGKTLAFLIPIVEHLLAAAAAAPLKQKKTLVRAIILSPTRELAAQTHRVATELCQCCRLPPPLLLVGGASAGSSSQRPVAHDLQRLQHDGSSMLIGTCGRVEDVLTKYAVADLTEFDYLILDEADVLLQMGFANSLNAIFGKLPKMRRTGLFSATTASANHSTLAEWMQRAGMRNAVWIDVAVTAPQVAAESAASRGTLNAALTTTSTPATLINYYLVTPLDEKVSRLACFLQDHAHEKVIVFFLTCACVDFYGHALQQLLPDVSIDLLHGKMVQKRREKVMERFRDAANDGGGGGDGALFCTDVAARGIDVSDIAWSVQFDAPQDPSFFVHRCGRTARAGQAGKSLVFLTPKEDAYVELLRMRKVPMQPLSTTERCCPVEEKASDDAVQDCDTTRDSQVGEISSRLQSAANVGALLDDVLPRIRDLVLKDRDMLEKGTRAFTSYIRAYKEHQCAFIFRFASLDLGFLASSFCLLRLPKMPELRDVLQKHHGKLPHFTPAGVDVDIFAIPFLDKAREKARQKRLEQEKVLGCGKNAKQIQAEERKAEKARRKEAKRAANIAKGRKPDKKRSKNAQMMDDWDDLAKEERLYKKLRRGKMSRDEYEAQMHDV